MKKLMIYLAAALLACGNGMLQAQDSVFMKFLRENPRRAGANTDPYEFPELKDTPAPKGYKPFYISHYGRHGSRSDWGEPDYRALVETLSSAKEAGLLTAGGDSLLIDAKAVLDGHDGMNGRLTPRGIREHRMLADRMFHRYKRVFTKGAGHVRAISSTVPRCIISMTGFTDRLTELAPKLEISWDTGEKFMKYICHEAPRSFMDSARAMTTAASRRPVPDTAYTLKRIFTDVTAARRLVPSADRFARQIFSTARIAGSYDMDTDPYRFLSETARCMLAKELNLYLYLGQCNSEALGNRRMPFSKELMLDILDKADEAIHGGEYSADLRFGHDYPLLALESFIGIEGVGECLSAEEALSRWYGFLHTPFAANLQLIFYRNNSGDVLVKFLRNEEETRIIDLPAAIGPYYRWEAVKNEMQRRIARWSVK